MAVPDGAALTGDQPDGCKSECTMNNDDSEVRPALAGQVVLVIRLTKPPNTYKKASSYLA
jgi:hypothetical protein